MIGELTRRGLVRGNIPTICPVCKKITYTYDATYICGCHPSCQEQLHSIKQNIHNIKHRGEINE